MSDVYFFKFSVFIPSACISALCTSKSKHLLKQEVFLCFFNSNSIWFFFFFKGNDFSFTVRRGQNSQMFGSAGDCYSKMQCPQVI